jgi:hypothetical protein
VGTPTAFAAASLLAPAAACVCAWPAADGEGVASEADRVAAASRTSPVLTGAEGFATAASCYARLRAMSRLYSAIAQQSSGEERRDMADLAFERELASSEYQLAANRLAGEIGRSVEEAGQAYRGAEAAVEREQAVRPFDDFMIWLAGESDRCPRPEREQV